MTELPEKIAQLLVDGSVIEETRALFEPFRASKVEGCVLWYGQVLDDAICRVATCIRPEQDNHMTCYAISSEAMRAVRKLVRPHGLLLLMQIHSHPGSAYFSKWDEENALNRRPGALNMVVPNFGTGHWIDIDRFCVVEMTDASVWKPWTRDDWTRLRIAPGNP